MAPWNPRKQWPLDSGRFEDGGEMCRRSDRPARRPHRSRPGIPDVSSMLCSSRVIRFHRECSIQRNRNPPTF